MTQELKFKIGSEFVGEGFKKARQEIAEVNNNIKSGTKIAGQLSSALGQMDTAASKNMQAMAGLAQAILTFNTTAIATQAMMIAINRYFGEMKEKAEEAQKAAEQLRVSMEKSFNDALTTSVTSIRNEVNALITDFESATKQANSFTAALQGVANSEAHGNIVNLQLEKLDKLLESHSEAERQTIEATYNLKIAVEKSANTHMEWQEKIDNAHQAIVDGENRVAKIDEQISVLGEKRRELEDVMITAKNSDFDKWKDISKQVNSLKEQEQALEKKKFDAESELDTLRVKEKQVKQDAVNAETQATVAIREAELADQKLTEARHNREVSEKAAKEAADLEKAAKERDTDVLKEAEKIQREANEAAKELKSAEKEYAAALKEYEKPGNLVADAARALTDKAMPGGLLPVDIQKGIQMKTADNAVDEAIRNHVINTVKDADKLQRQAQREARDAITKEQRQQLQEAKKYKRLQEMNPKALASSDKEFMRKYEKILAAAEEQKKELAERKKRLDDAKNADQKKLEALSDIKGKLDGIKDIAPKIGDMGTAIKAQGNAILAAVKMN